MLDYVIMVQIPEIGQISKNSISRDLSKKFFNDGANLGNAMQSLCRTPDFYAKICILESILNNCIHVVCVLFKSTVLVFRDRSVRLNVVIEYNHYIYNRVIWK